MDEASDSKYSLLVKIEPPMSTDDVGVAGDEDDFNCLEMHMENITGNDCEFFKFNGRRSYAMIKFKEPIIDVNELQKKYDAKPLNAYKITLEMIPLVDKVLVTGLPFNKIDCSEGLENCDLVLYFENKKFCPDGGDIKNLVVLPCRHAAVVEFADYAVVKTLKEHHILLELPFTVRPLNVFEYFEGPSCTLCNEDKYADDMAEDNEQASFYSADEDTGTGSQKNEWQSGSQSNSDTDEDMERMNWSTKNEGASQNEHSSFVGGSKSSSGKKSADPEHSEISQLILTTIKYKRIPGLLPEEHDMIKLSGSGYEIVEPDQRKKDRIRKATEDAMGSGEVDLADYTGVADKLNNDVGRKWIKELLKDLKIPATLKHNKSTLTFHAINLELAEEAAKAVAISLLPAKIKCDQNQMSKCSKILQEKNLMYRSCKSGYLELLGIPMNVLRVVNEIEKKLHGSIWPK